MSKSLKNEIRDMLMPMLPGMLPGMIPQLGALPPHVLAGIERVMARVTSGDDDEADDGSPKANDLMTYAINRVHISDTDFRAAVEDVMMSRDHEKTSMLLAFAILRHVSKKLGPKPTT